MDLEVVEASLRQFIDHVREDGPSDGRWILNEGRVRLGGPPVVIGLARFQSYRARTEAALVQELTDWVELDNIGTINFHVNQNDDVILW